MGEKRNKRKGDIKKFIIPLIAILIIIAVVQLVSLRRHTGFVHLLPENGVLDISGINFENDIYTIANDWDFYGEKLYFPEDFKSEPEGLTEQSANDFSFGTHRLILKAQPNKYFSMCGYATDYASRIFVGGSEVANFGNVADNAKDAVHGVGYQTIPIFTGESGEVEIIIQYCNFVHNDGGTIHMLYFSTPQNIEEYKMGNNVVSITLGGGLLILSLYFFLYFALQRQVNYLLLAFCALVFAMRDQLFAFIHLLPPSMDWALEYRLNILVVNLLPFSLLLLMSGMFPYGKKFLRWAYCGVMGVFVILIFILNTKSLVTLNIIAYFCSLPYLVYMIVEIIRHFVKEKKIPNYNIVSLSGFALLFFALITEGLMSISGRSSSVIRYGFTPGAMLIFIFLVALSIGIKVREGEVALANSKNYSELLKKMNTMNMDFLRKIAHELKTPLTVISGYAQLTEMQLKSDSISEETPENLKTIHLEALRLADMATSLMNYSLGENTEMSFGKVNIKTLFKNASSICTPMCLKKQNRVEFFPIDEDVYGNGEMLLQVIINLAVNSNKHTENGLIEVKAKRQDDETVYFTFSDNGCGIDEKILPDIFEKGISGDGGSGLGLAICKEIIEAQGGKIWVEKTDEKGTTFAFTLVLWEEK